MEWALIGTVILALVGAVYLWARKGADVDSLAAANKAEADKIKAEETLRLEQEQTLRTKEDRLAEEIKRTRDVERAKQLLRDATRNDFN